MSLESRQASWCSAYLRVKGGSGQDEVSARSFSSGADSWSFVGYREQARGKACSHGLAGGFKPDGASLSPAGTEPGLCLGSQTLACEEWSYTRREIRFVTDAGRKSAPWVCAHRPRRVWQAQLPNGNCSRLSPLQPSVLALRQSARGVRSESMTPSRRALRRIDSLLAALTPTFASGESASDLHPVGNGGPD